MFGGEFTSVHGAVGITDEIEESTEGGRDVEIVIEGGGEIIFRGGGMRGASFRRGRQFGDPLLPFVESLQGAARGGQAFEGEVEGEAVVGGEQDVAHFASGPTFVEQVTQGVKVAERLGHLASVDHEVGAMHPQIDERLARAAFGLGDFGLVVGEDVVDSSAMDIEPVAKHSGGHGTAFDVPAGATRTPRAVPLHVAVGRIVRFPEGEVADVFLFVFIGADAARGAEFVQVEMGEFPVAGKAGDAEVDRLVVRLVGVTAGDELRDHGDHARNVLRFGRRGESVSGFDAQRREVLEKGVLEGFGEIGQGNAFLPGAADGFVVHVGQVHDALDAESAVFKMALEKILEEVGAEIADVGMVVDGRSAGVDLDLLAVRIEGDKWLGCSRQRVVKVEQGSGGLRGRGGGDEGGERRLET